MRGSGSEALFVLFLLIFLYTAFLLAGRMMHRNPPPEEQEEDYQYQTSIEPSRL